MTFLQSAEFSSDFRIIANLGCAFAALLLLTPFAINNLIQGRLFLGFTSFGIVIVSGLNAWSIINGKFRPFLFFLVLVPCIIITLILATQKLGIIGIVWSYPAVLAFYFMLSERQAWVGNSALLLIIIPLGWSVLEDAVAVRVVISLSLVSVFSAIFIRVISYQQNRLLEEKRRAEAANRAKSEFIANMSHEIRTPLNAVIGFSELLEQTEVTAKQKSYLQSINLGGKTLLSLINDILDLSKIEADKLTLEPRPVLVRQVFEDICHIFGPRARDKNIEIRLEFAQDVPSCLMLDETRIRQILFNIIGNAIKFTHHGHIKISIWRKNNNDVSAAVTQLRIDIEDTGIGIAKDQQHTVFASFEQQEGQNNRQYGGTGLGLSICNKLVQMMDGEITLVSVPGQGTTFSIHLNHVFECQHDMEEKTKLHQLMNRIQFEPATVLIVGGLNRNLRQVVGILQHTSLKLIEVNNIEQAQNVCLLEKPALLLIDMNILEADNSDIKTSLKLIDTPIFALLDSKEPEPQAIELRDCDEMLNPPIAPQPFIKQILLHLPHQMVDVFSNDNTPKQSFELSMEKNDQAMQEINQVVIPLWHKAEKTGIFDDAMAFSHALNDIAKKYQMSGMLVLSERVKQAVNNFEITELEKVFSEFNQIIQHWKNNPDDETS